MMALGGKEPVVPLADFADAFETQRVLEAVCISAADRRPVKLSEVR
jgi:predicted dehydrogenase